MEDMPGMPKYRPETAKRKAETLTKLHIQNGLNQSRVAKIEGVTPSAINHRLQQPLVKKTLQDTINKNLQKAGITQCKVYRKLNEELDATRVISAMVSPDGKDKDANGQTCDFIDVPDWHARDKAIDKSLTLMGHIKTVNGNGKGHVLIQIINGYRNNNTSPAGPLRAEVGQS